MYGTLSKNENKQANKAHRLESYTNQTDYPLNSLMQSQSIHIKIIINNVCRVFTLFFFRKKLHSKCSTVPTLVRFWRILVRFKKLLPNYPVCDIAGGGFCVRYKLCCVWYYVPCIRASVWRQSGSLYYIEAVLHTSVQHQQYCTV